MRLESESIFLVYESGVGGRESKKWSKFDFGVDSGVGIKFFEGRSLELESKIGMQRSGFEPTTEVPIGFPPFICVV